jgi:hypothetical protein
VVCVLRTLMQEDLTTQRPREVSWLTLFQRLFLPPENVINFEMLINVLTLTYMFWYYFLNVDSGNTNLAFGVAFLLLSSGAKESRREKSI